MYGSIKFGLIFIAFFIGSFGVSELTLLMKYFAFFIMLYRCSFHLHVISWHYTFANYFTCTQLNTVIRTKTTGSGKVEEGLRGIGDKEVDAIIAGAGAVDADKTHRGIRGQ